MNGKRQKSKPKRRYVLMGLFFGGPPITFMLPWPHGWRLPRNPYESTFDRLDREEREESK